MYYDRIPLKLVIIHTVDLRRARCAWHCIKHHVPRTEVGPPMAGSLCGGKWIVRKPQVPRSNLFLRIKLYSKSWLGHKTRDGATEPVPLSPQTARPSAKVHASSGRPVLTWLSYSQVLVELSCFLSPPPRLYSCSSDLPQTRSWGYPRGVPGSLSADRGPHPSEERLIKTLVRRCGQDGLPLRARGPCPDPAPAGDCQ